MRLIDADGLIMDLVRIERMINCTHPLVIKLFGDMQNWVEEQPTVNVVPVVRCKDCKYYKVEGGQCPADNTGDRYYSWIPDPDWFCADGERREE